MDERPDLNKKLANIERLLTKQEYTASARECAITIEQALRQAVNQHLDRFDETIRQKVEEEARKRAKHGQGLDGLTMGQMVYVLRDAGFFAAWGQVAGKNLHSFQIIDLEKLTQLRNRFMHDGAEANQTEAEFLLTCLRIILETFDLHVLLQNENTGQSQTNVGGQTTMVTTQIPFDFQKRIIDFLLTLPELADTPAQRAFISSAGLDLQLQQRIRVTDPPQQFFHLLVPVLSQYGTLEDGRHALQAILEAAKAYVGQEGRAGCEGLLRELQAILVKKPSNTISSGRTPGAAIKPPSLDTQILRVLAEYYQQHPGDPEMALDDLLSALPQHQVSAIQAQLFALKKKDWISYDLNPEGNAGLVWIEPRGLKFIK